MRAGRGSGADAASMGRSIPLDKAMDDSLLALFQNGEDSAPGTRLSHALVQSWLGRQYQC